MTIDEKYIENFKKQCVKAGLKITNQRLTIFKALAMSKEHPDIDSIFKSVRKEMPNISLDTVYRTMDSFESAGLIMKIAGNKNMFRFDANLDGHQHFICKKCGVIEDIAIPEVDKIRPSKELKKIGQFESYHLQIHGICNNCLNKAE